MSDTKTLINPDSRQADPDQERTQPIVNESGIPAAVGKYQILEEVGRGACGIVYRGRDSFVQRDVAIKVSFSEDAQPNPNLQKVFFIEARAAGRLQHPNIVAVFDAGIDRTTTYIVMEYVDGQTLGQLARSATPPTAEQIVKIAFDCAKALDYSHRADVLHRDIKPDNIMLRNDGVTKLMDFSVAALMQNQSVRPDVVLGTPSYMAPEQIRGKDIGPATDLYSLGAVMYRLLVGHPPHVAESQRELLNLIKSTPATPLDCVRPELPKMLCDIVDRLLSLDPADRFSSGHELALELLKVYDRRAAVLQRTPHEAERMALEALSFCRDMSPAEIDELLAAGKIRRVSAGDAIFHAGDTDTKLYLIVMGNVMLIGMTQITLTQSEVFGSLALPGAMAADCDALAASDGLLLEVERAALDACSDACRFRVYQACCAVLNYRVSLLAALSGN